MDEYVALRDCYYDGRDLKKGDTFKVAKGTVVEFKLVKLIEVEEPVIEKDEEDAKKKATSKK